MNNTAVTVYGKPACVQCTATVRHLNKLGINHTYVDVTEDRDAFDFIKGLGYQQAPVVYTSADKHWSGFNPDLLNELAQ